jgi:hypothetical protein
MAPKKDRKKEDALEYGLRQVTGLFVHAMPHVHDLPGWFHHALTLDKKISRGGAAVHADPMAERPPRRHGSPNSRFAR